MLIQMLNFQGIIRTSRPDLFPVLKQHPRDWHEHYRDETQQASCPRNTQTLIHLQGEQREYSTECVPQESVCRQRRSTVLRLVCVE
jgi:hypothetical protein